MLSCFCESFLYLSFVTFISLFTLRSILANNPDLRYSFFAPTCDFLNKKSDPEIIDMKCKTLTDFVGPTVVEVGAGPGNSFKCFSDSDKARIKTFVAVEPNPYFEPYLKEAAKKENIHLKIFQNFTGIENEFADSVIMSHVLCSAEDQAQLLKEISRILKKDGTFSYIEHIASPEGTFIRNFQNFLQDIIGWAYFAGGCTFHETDKDLDKWGPILFSKNSYEKFDFSPLPLFLSPHLKGKAIK